MNLKLASFDIDKRVYLQDSTNDASIIVGISLVCKTQWYGQLLQQCLGRTIFSKQTKNSCLTINTTTEQQTKMQYYTHVYNFPMFVIWKCKGKLAKKLQSTHFETSKPFFLYPRLDIVGATSTTSPIRKWANPRGSIWIPGNMKFSTNDNYCRI